MSTELIENAEIGQEANKPFVMLALGTIASDFALKNLNKALGEAQNEFEPAVKAEENKYVGYKYVPLECLVAAVRPSLTKHHLTISQFAVTDLELKIISLHTRLVHWDSGEWMQNELVLPAELALGKEGALKFNQQTIGGSQTYAQKYAYKAILGVPDSEELIDSTDEKGDIPSTKSQDAVREAARQKAESIRTTPAQAMKGATPTTATTKQVRRVSPNYLQFIVADIKLWPADGKTNACMNVAFPGKLLDPAGKWVCEYATCWHSSLFDLLESAVGKDCKFFVTERDKDGRHFVDINDVVLIDGVEYMDGQPVVEGDGK